MIDVFICTYNPNHTFLKRTVEGILNQNLDKSKWTLAIIDNNSPSPVSEIDWIQNMGIRVIVEKVQGLAAARACATEAAEGEILVFVDDDNILDPSYLAEVEKTFKDPSIAIISGHILPEYVATPESWFNAFEEMVAIRRLAGDSLILSEKPVHSSTFPIGAGMAIRYQLMVDYYNDDITKKNFIEGRKGNALSSCEDLDLDLYALYRGKKIGVNPKLKLIHIIPPNRTTVSYISKLALASLKSSAFVNAKWSPIFKHDVFDYFALSTYKAIAGTILNGVLSFDKGRRVKYHFFKGLLKYNRYKYKQST